MGSLGGEVAALLAAVGDDHLTAVVDLGVLVAAADGSIDDAEAERLGELLDGAMGGLLEPRLVRHFVREARARCEEEGLEARARAVGAELAAAGAEALRVATAIARASQGISDAERALLAALAAGAGLDARALDDAAGAA